MRLTHKANHGWAPNRNDPEWEQRVEREALATTNSAERTYAKAQARLKRAEERLLKATARADVPPRRLAVMEAIVEERRQELLALARLMNGHGAPSTSRGRKSHRGVPGTRPL